MKDEINLLPPDALSARKQRVLMRRERALFVAIVCAFLFILGGYGGTWWYLHGIKNSLEDQIMSQNKDRTSITEQNEAFNKDISTIDSRIGGFTLWTAHLPDVIGVVPKGILVHRIELVENPQTLVVTGTASLGSDVVEYQTALEKLPWVDHVDAPLQNFARAPEAVVVFTIFHKQPAAL